MSPIEDSRVTSGFWYRRVQPSSISTRVNPQIKAMALTCPPDPSMTTGDYARLGASKFRACPSRRSQIYDAAERCNLINANSRMPISMCSPAIETLASSRAEERSVKRQLDQAEKRLEVGLGTYHGCARSSCALMTVLAPMPLPLQPILSTMRNEALVGNYRATGIENIQVAWHQTINPSIRRYPHPRKQWVTLAMESNPSSADRRKSIGSCCGEKDVEAAARAAHYPTLDMTATLARLAVATVPGQVLQPLDLGQTPSYQWRRQQKHRHYN